MAGGLDLSCRDWAERLQTGRSIIPEIFLPDLAAGNRAVAVFNRLRLSDVPGNPTLAEAGGDWFRDIIRIMFGSLDPVTNRRMIRELFLMLSKKQSKTTNGALLMLTALLLNERPRAQLLMTAPVQDVAEIAFEAAAGAIELDPVLDKKLHIRRHLKIITHRETQAQLKIITFDPAVLTGQKCAAVLIDELHVVAKMSKAASAIRQLRGGMLPFPEGFLAFITTQSEDAPAGVFRAELQKARAIRDGTRKGAMLPVLYEFPREMQADKDAWRDSRNWHMVAPNLGRSIDLHRLREGFQEATETGEEELRAWASQHLNVEIGLALHSDRWAGADFWEDQARAVTLEELLKRSDVVTLGIDGGGLDDMLAMAAIGRDEKTREWLHWAHAWMHPIVLEKRKSEAQRFRDFERDGDLTIVAKIGDDIEELVGYVQRVEDSGLLDRVGVDANGIATIVASLTGQGVRPPGAPPPKLKLEQDRIVAVPQGWKLVGVIKTTERKLAEGGLIHGGRPLMAWCVGNAKVEPRGNAVIITKQAAGYAKIDPLMATFNAAALMSMDPKPRRKSYQMFVVGGTAAAKTGG